MSPDLDSNQDRQIQNLTYYHYTIGQEGYEITKVGRRTIASFALLRRPKATDHIFAKFKVAFTSVSLVKRKNAKRSFALQLAYEDSNLDKQNQNLSYYHYTIGQYPPYFSIRECKNKVRGQKYQKEVGLVYRQTGTVRRDAQTVECIILSMHRTRLSLQWGISKLYTLLIFDLSNME